ncbi:MAG: hypothetical protein BWY15_00444 [Firmicutes bacterium ADurb.Bin193]|nr:MAG: hypothetical protein BWY15_00444 [Firmicutes bacterium ADurb.Bin193]
MTLYQAVKVAKERIMLNSSRQDEIQNPVRAEFIRETTEALQALVDCAETVRSGWSGADERLPECSGNYLTWYVSEEYGAGAVIQKYDTASKSWGMAAALGGTVSHWMPLPEAPVQEKKHGGIR